MIAGDMKPVEVIIGRKGKKGNKTAGIKIPDPLQVLNTLYSRVIDDIEDIIEMKRAMKSIGINNNSQASNENG